jgi:hypothetical protein
VSKEFGGHHTQFHTRVLGSPIKKADKSKVILHEMNREGYKPWQGYWVRQRGM